MGEDGNTINGRWWGQTEGRHKDGIKGINTKQKKEGVERKKQIKDEGQEEIKEERRSQGPEEDRKKVFSSNKHSQGSHLMLCQCYAALNQTVEGLIQCQSG